MRILVVEDEVQLATMIGRVLRDQQYDVDLAHDGTWGLELALTGSYDALVLDRMLPGLDGLALCRQLREAGIATPVLILSARRDTPERVEGLDAGADDYLGKPFALTELLARVRALTRRRDKPLLPRVLRAGAVTLDQLTRHVELAGRPVELSPREYALLEFLLRNAGRALSREQIIERVWGFDAEAEPTAVDLYVHYLRKKLAIGRDDTLIRTVRGVGYMIPAE
jgi:DNA-binding response OmpR family regulator